MSHLWSNHTTHVLLHRHKGSLNIIVSILTILIFHLQQNKANNRTNHWSFHAVKPGQNYANSCLSLQLSHLVYLSLSLARALFLSKRFLETLFKKKNIAHTNKLRRSYEITEAGLLYPIGIVDLGHEFFDLLKAKY